MYELFAFQHIFEDWFEFGVFCLYLCFADCFALFVDFFDDFCVVDAFSGGDVFDSEPFGTHAQLSQHAFEGVGACFHLVVAVDVVAVIGQVACADQNHACAQSKRLQNEFSCNSS